MHLTRRPLNGPIGVEVRNKGIGIPTLKRPGHQPDLHRGVRHPGCRTRRLEVDGGEAALADEIHRRHESQETRIKMKKRRIFWLFKT